MLPARGFPSNQLEGVVERPFHSLLHGLVEHERKERDGHETELHITNKLATSFVTKNHSTYPNRPPSPQSNVLDILQRPPTIPHNTMYRKSRQAHTRQALKHRPLRRYRPIVLQRRHPSLRRHRSRPPNRWSLVGPLPDALVARVGFVPFVADVADEIGPGDGVGGADDVGVGDGAEGLADVGGVGYVAVGGEEDGADAGCVGGVAEGGVC